MTNSFISSTSDPSRIRLSFYDNVAQEYEKELQKISNPNLKQDLTNYLNGGQVNKLSINYNPNCEYNNLSIVNGSVSELHIKGSSENIGSLNNSLILELLKLTNIKRLIFECIVLEKKMIQFFERFSITENLLDALVLKNCFINSSLGTGFIDLSQVPDQISLLKSKLTFTEKVTIINAQGVEQDIEIENEGADISDGAILESRNIEVEGKKKPINLLEYKKLELSDLDVKQRQREVIDSTYIEESEAHIKHENVTKELNDEFNKRFTDGELKAIDISSSKNDFVKFLIQKVLGEHKQPHGAFLFIKALIIEAKKNKACIDKKIKEDNYSVMVKNPFFNPFRRYVTCSFGGHPYEIMTPGRRHMLWLATEGFTKVFHKLDSLQNYTGKVFTKKGERLIANEFVRLTDIIEDYTLKGNSKYYISKQLETIINARKELAHSELIEVARLIPHDPRSKEKDPNLLDNMSLHRKKEIAHAAKIYSTILVVWIFRLLRSMKVAYNVALEAERWYTQATEPNIYKNRHLILFLEKGEGPPRVLKFNHYIYNYICSIALGELLIENTKLSYEEKNFSEKDLDWQKKILTEIKTKYNQEQVAKDVSDKILKIKKENYI